MAPLTFSSENVLVHFISDVLHVLMFCSVSDHSDRNGVVLDTIHIERSWHPREDHRDRGLLLPQPVSTEDFPFPWYVTAFPLHFMDIFMELCAFSPGIQFTVKLWELFGRVLFLSKEREVAPTHIKCTSIKTPYILDYNQWRKAFETLYFISGTVQPNKSCPPLLMTFFCSTQMEKVKRKSLNSIKQAP